MSEPAPCMPYPEDASFKTIGLAPCNRCGSNECWLHYLRWEVRIGIKLNEKHHHLVLITESFTPAEIRAIRYFLDDNASMRETAIATEALARLVRER